MVKVAYESPRLIKEGRFADITGGWILKNWGHLSDDGYNYLVVWG